jgi:hypothetical protein
MNKKTKRIVARTPEALAKAIGLPGAEATEWRVQYSLLKRLRREPAVTAPLKMAGERNRPLRNRRGSERGCTG